MRFSASYYAQLLDCLLSKTRTDEDVREQMYSFLAFVALNNDLHLLRKIYFLFEDRFCIRERVRRLKVEISENIKNENQFIRDLREVFSERDEEVVVDIRENRHLISGARVTIEDSYVVDASLKGLLDQLFSSKTKTSAFGEISGLRGNS